MGNWTLESIAWDRFDPSKVDPEILRNIKAAAMVERNGSDYAIYLSRVFADDPKAVDDVGRWSLEEVQHGMALGRWAQLADPSWDFDAAFARFRAGYQLPLDATRSVRGSQAGEMMARCIVETGTSSYYTALAEASASRAHTLAMPLAIRIRSVAPSSTAAFEKDSRTPIPSGYQSVEKPAASTRCAVGRPSEAGTAVRAPIQAPQVPRRGRIAARS